jgi:hypothetical protein
MAMSHMRGIVHLRAVGTLQLAARDAGFRTCERAHTTDMRVA